MAFDNVRTIWFTELQNHIRDHRALMALLFISLMGPVGILVMMFVVDNLAGEDNMIKLDIIGADHAPGLVQMLERENHIEITLRDAAGGMPEMGEAEVVLVIPADYGERYLANIPARVTLYRDDRSQRSTIVSRDLQNLLGGYSRQIAGHRLMTRGVPAQTVVPISVGVANIAPKDSQSLQLANLVLYFLLFVPFFAGMSITIDSTAGERERGSLLPLMAQPISTAGLVMGKFLCILSFGLVAQVIATIATFNVLHFVPKDAIPLNIPLDFMTQLRILLVLAPLALMAAPLQIFFALSSRSYKEANSYLQILAIVPIGLVVYGTMISSQASGAEKFVPVVAQSDMMKQVIANGAVPWPEWSVGVVIAIAIGVVALWGAIRKLDDESILRAA